MQFLKRLLGSDIASLTPVEAQERQKTLLIIDVRQPDEYASGHISGAKLIPLNQLARRMSELPQDQEILCVCRSGARSSAAVRQLTQAGYKAINLSGGMGNWQRAGLPIKRGK